MARRAVRHSASPYRSDLTVDIAVDLVPYTSLERFEVIKRVITLVIENKASWTVEKTSPNLL